MGVSTTSLNVENLPSQVRSFVQKDALTVQFFYEGHPDHATEEDLIDVTLYTVGSDKTEGPCNLNGVALIDDAGSAFYTVTPLVAYSDDTFNDSFTPTGVDQCFP